MIVKVLETLKANIIQKRIIKPKNDARSIHFFNYPYQALEEVVVDAFYHRDHLQFPIKLYKNVYEAICLNPKIKYSQLEDNLGVGETSIYRAINWLKENGYINSERSKIKGVWQREK